MSEFRLGILKEYCSTANIFCTNKPLAATALCCKSSPATPLARSWPHWSSVSSTWPIEAFQNTECPSPPPAGARGWSATLACSVAPPSWRRQKLNKVPWHCTPTSCCIAHISKHQSSPRKTYRSYRHGTTKGPLSSGSGNICWMDSATHPQPSSLQNQSRKEQLKMRHNCDIFALQCWGQGPLRALGSPCCLGLAWHIYRCHVYRILYMPPCTQAKRHHDETKN